MGEPLSRTRLLYLGQRPQSDAVYQQWEGRSIELAARINAAPARSNTSGVSPSDLDTAQAINGLLPNANVLVIPRIIAPGHSPDSLVYAALVGRALAPGVSKEERGKVKVITPDRTDRGKMFTGLAKVLFDAPDLKRNNGLGGRDRTTQMLKEFPRSFVKAIQFYAQSYWAENKSPGVLNGTLKDGSLKKYVETFYAAHPIECVTGILPHGLEQLPDNFFDLILAFDQFAQIPEINKPHFVDQIRRLTRSQGRVLFRESTAGALATAEYYADQIWDGRFIPEESRNLREPHFWLSYLKQNSGTRSFNAPEATNQGILTTEQSEQLNRKNEFSAWVWGQVNPSVEILNPGPDDWRSTAEYVARTELTLLSIKKAGHLQTLINDFNGSITNVLSFNLASESVTPSSAAK